MAGLWSVTKLACLLGLTQLLMIIVNAQIVPGESSKDVRFQRKKLAPSCDNFLSTVLRGRWIPKRPPSNVPLKQRREMQSVLNREKEDLDETMRFVWKKKGSPPNPWRSTTVCGFYRLRRATKLRPSIGKWCDPDGPTPCCSNVLYGKCVPKDRFNGCTCSKCVNVQNMKHAELMDWKPYDSQCQYHQYTPAQACDVIETSAVKELYFVGDSFILNMYSSMLMLLTGKPVKGGWPKTLMTDDEKEICSNYGSGYWQPCRATTLSLDQMLYRDNICGDGRNVTFKMDAIKYYNAKFEKDFKEFVRTLLGKKGTYVIVGIGYHIQMRLNLAIDHFMKPAVDLVRNYYRKKKRSSTGKRWPQFIFSYPLEYGILKPTRYLRANYITKQQLYQKGMESYCKQNSIPILDFNPLTKNVLSFDGIHYGIAVNMAKSQILLNYFASLSDL